MEEAKPNPMVVLHFCEFHEVLGTLLKFFVHARVCRATSNCPDEWLCVARVRAPSPSRMCFCAMLFIDFTPDAMRSYLYRRHVLECECGIVSGDEQTCSFRPMKLMCSTRVMLTHTCRSFFFLSLVSPIIFRMDKQDLIKIRLAVQPLAPSSWRRPSRTAKNPRNSDHVREKLMCVCVHNTFPSICWQICISDISDQNSIDL